MGSTDKTPGLKLGFHLVTDAQTMFEHACSLNWEGIISKRADAPYRSDRNEGWLKIKCSQRGKFPVVGFIKEPGGIAALYLGKRVGKELTYVGKVGTGFTRAASAELRRRLEPLITPEQKLTKKVRKPKATWVRPELLAEVEYRGTSACFCDAEITTSTADQHVYEAHRA